MTEEFLIDEIFGGDGIYEPFDVLTSQTGGNNVNFGNIEIELVMAAYCVNRSEAAAIISRKNAERRKKTETAEHLGQVRR